MSSKPTSRVSQYMESAKLLTKRLVQLLNKVFKPGGWRYLRPVETEDTTHSDETTQQLLKATEQLEQTDTKETARKTPRSKRAA